MGIFDLLRGRKRVPAVPQAVVPATAVAPANARAEILATRKVLAAALASGNRRDQILAREQLQEAVRRFKRATS